MLEKLGIKAELIEKSLRHILDVVVLIGYYVVIVQALVLLLWLL